MRRPAAAALAVALAAGLIAAVLSGCTSPPPAPTVAVALPSRDGRWDDVARMLRARLQSAGYTVVVRVAADDIPTQVRQVSELLRLRPLALIVAPVDASSLTTPLDAADPGIDVVALGTLVRDTGAVDRLVAFDPAAEGFLQATALLQGLGLVDAGGAPVPGAPTGPFRIELFAGSPEEPRTEPCLAAAMSVLQPYLDRGILSVGSREVALDDLTTLRGKSDTAASRMTRLLHDAYGDAAGQAWPDAVLTPSDAIARGVARALIEAGAMPGEHGPDVFPFPVLTGRGAELRSLAALADGRQYATLIEDPRLLADEAADRVIAALASAPAVPTDLPPVAAVDNGARSVPASLLQAVVVRADDVQSAIVDSGYWSRERVDAAIAEFGLR
ncbi:MAG: xylF [Schumannella sp.]|nr:xylF [Schumannella sp.]